MTTIGAWTYENLRGIFANRATRKLANNTYARMDGDTVVIRLHATDIARLAPDGTVTLNSGGWQTVTTKGRMNGCLPTYMGICQKNHAWTLRTWGPLGDSSTPFRDGMTVATRVGVVA